MRMAGNSRVVRSNRWRIAERRKSKRNLEPMSNRYEGDLLEPLFKSRESETELTAKENALEDGEVYVCRNGKLERLPKSDDGMRRIRITDDAYQAALELGQRLRKDLHGYKPDVSLVASALILERCRETNSTQVKEVIGNFIIKLFKSASS